MASTLIPTTNACSRLSACGGYGSAVDGNTTAGTLLSTAYACYLVSTCGGQTAHSTFLFRLGVDGQAVARFHLDTLVRIQMAPILQDQMDFSGDIDARGEIDRSLDNVPACSPVGDYAVSGKQGVSFYGFLVLLHKLLCVLVPVVADIGYRFLLQRIYHTVEHSKQAVENLRPGDFCFLLVRQGVVGIIGRLQFLISRLLFLFGHISQLVRRGKGVDLRLHRTDGAHISAGCSLSGRGIAALTVMLMLAV